MRRDRVALVQDSFRELLPAASAAADAFHERLFQIAPELRPLFPADLAQAREPLLRMVRAAVEGLSRPEALVATLQRLGRRLGALGVKLDHYEAAGEAFLAALARGLGRALTPEVRSAWLEAYWRLSNVVLDAQRGRA